MVPADNPEGLLGIHGWVPIDDTSWWIYGFTWSVNGDLTDEQRERFRRGTGGIYAELLPGEYVARRNHTNDYEFDRNAQLCGAHWSGVTGNQEQDDIITASMGPAYDRSRERLVPTDAAVIATRQALLSMAADVEAGAAPAARGWPGLAGCGYDVPSVFIEVGGGADWYPQQSRRCCSSRPGRGDDCAGGRRAHRRGGVLPGGAAVADRRTGARQGWSLAGFGPHTRSSPTARRPLKRSRWRSTGLTFCARN